MGDCLNLHAPAKAEIYFRAALVARPQEAVSYDCVGTSLARQQRYEEAIDYYQRALEQDPKYARAKCDYAEALNNLGRFDEALAIYQAEYAKINGLHTRLYPDVEAGLRAMRDAGLKLACVTNKPHRFALELLQQYGLVPAASPGSDPNTRPPPACAVFDVQIGDLPGRAVGFDVADGSAVIVIAGDDQVALVLSIFQRKQSPGAMRDKAMDMIPLFRMQRPTGDITLLRWIR